METGVRLCLSWKRVREFDDPSAWVRRVAINRLRYQPADSPGNPIPDLGLTLDKVLEAIVPLDDLPSTHLDPPPGHVD